MALVNCRECGKEVAQDAKACPHCGIEKPGEANGSVTVENAMKAIPVLLLVGVVLFFCTNINGNKDSQPASKTSDEPKISSAANQEVVTDLLKKKVACTDAITALEAKGAVRIRDGNGYTTAEYNEYAWATLEHDDKIRQGLLVYCAKMPNNGEYTVLIQGLHNGKTMASVVNGNYFDE
jgi:hypothetical protein